MLLPQYAIRDGDALVVSEDEGGSPYITLPPGATISGSSELSRRSTAWYSTTAWTRAYRSGPTRTVRSL